jgi:pimeloyl-ACP methyl ester carboxylesterase
MMGKTTWKWRKSEFLKKSGVEIRTYIDGEGPAFVILPSYGRDSGEDFDAITARVVEAGWKVLRPQPQGVAGSKGPMADLTMHDLANDGALSLRSLGDSRLVLLGHAFGNLLARMVAADYPDLVKAVILAAAQASAVPEDIRKTPFIAGDTSAPGADRLAALRKAFFAPNHDVSGWLDGWYPATLNMQRALNAVPFSNYWARGSVPLLEVIPACDPFKWQELRNQFPERVTTVVIEDASHALFPEQPDIVVDTVPAWLSRYR